jgi:hypothetical protein
MIQIAAAIKSGADVAGSAASASADGPLGGGAASSFMALFAQTLSARGNSPSLSFVQSDLALTGGKDTPSGDAKDDMKDINRDPAQDVDSMALMQSLLLSTMNVIPDKVALPTTEASLDRPAGKSAEIGLLEQKSDNGKNLPDLLATFAGQQSGVTIQAKPDVLAQVEYAQGHAGAQNVTNKPRVDVLAQSQPDIAAKDVPEGRFFDVLKAKVDGAISAPASMPHTQAQAASLKGTDSQMASLVSLTGQTAPQISTTPVNANTAIPMQTGFGSPGWSQELGDKVVWMSTSQGHSSQLVLNPPSLGTVEVRLQVHGSEAGAQFYSANADVRNAIEAAMPKLREMLADAGIALGEAMVSNQSFSQREAYQPPQQTTPGAASSGVLSAVGGAGGSNSAPSVTGAGMSLLDYYA